MNENFAGWLFAGDIYKKFSKIKNKTYLSEFYNGCIYITSQTKPFDETIAGFYNIPIFDRTPCKIIIKR